MDAIIPLDDGDDDVQEIPPPHETTVDKQQQQQQQQAFQQTIFSSRNNNNNTNDNTNNNNYNGGGHGGHGGHQQNRYNPYSSPHTLHSSHHSHKQYNRQYNSNQQHNNPHNNQYNNQKHNNNQQQQYQRTQSPRANPKQAAWAAGVLGSEATDVVYFDDFDPLNSANKLCRKTDKLLIVGVNKPLKPPVVITSAPTPTHAFRGRTFTPKPSKNCTKYFLSYKWNGVSVTVFKYQDADGNVFISARPRGLAFLRDTEHGKYLSVFVDYLSKLEPPVSLPLKMDNLPQALFQLNFDVQSITCELFGTNMPHLIRYPYEVMLKPLYYTHNDSGDVCPISEIEEGLVMTPTDTAESISEALATAVEVGLGLYCGPIVLPDDPSVLEKFCMLLTTKAHEMNAQHRRSSGQADNSRSFDNFLVEGWVLHLLDENGFVVDKNMFLLQPDDIRKTHWEYFGVDAQLKALEALRDIRLKGKANVSPQDLKRELGLSNAQWARWGRDVMGLVDGVPMPVNVSQRPKNALRMILLVGIPGSGKSTLARQLVGKGWDRCNQDELGTRKQVEVAVTNSLRDGKNVIIDRCNFDIQQRHTWLKLAQQYGVKWITCIILRVDPEICKQRVSVREGHQTIMSGDHGFAIIDKFKDLWVEPHIAEGFCEIIELKTDAEIDNAVLRLVNQHLESKVEEMSSTIHSLRKRVGELESKNKQLESSKSNNMYSNLTSDT